MRCEEAKQVDTQCNPTRNLDTFNELVSVQTQMTLSLSESSSNDELCHIASTYIPQLIDVSRCHFHHIENYFTKTQESNFAPYNSQQFPTRLKNSLIEDVLHKKETLVLNDLSSYPHEGIGECLDAGITALMVTPVFLNEEVVAVIILERITDTAFEELDRKIMHQTAATLGLRLERNLLLKSKEEHLASSMEAARINALLNQMYVELGEANTLDRIYSITSAWVSKILGGVHNSISKIDLRSNKIVFLHQHTQKQDSPFGSETLLDTSSYTELMIFRKALRESNLKASQFSDHQRLHQKLGAHSTLSTPLIVSGKMFGAIHVSSIEPNAYGKDEEYFLTQIASHVAILIENWKNKKSLENHAKEVDRVNSKLNVTIHNMHERETELIHFLEANKELMSITSHDLKNPLGGILGLCDMLIEDLPDLTGATVEDVIENTHLIKQEAEHMMGIIKSMLDKHRKEVKHEFALKETNMVELINDVIQSNQSQASSKNIQIYFNHGDESLFNVDASSFQRAIDNYLSNAIKYSPQNSNVWIDLDAHSLDGSYWKVSVRDEGPGLTQSDMQRVFRKMQRLSAKPTAGEHSTGLGLYIVKQIVEQHGGSVGVDSEFGEGALFWMLIPQLHKFMDKLHAESAIQS